jgi:hypothetical protein
VSSCLHYAVQLTCKPEVSSSVSPRHSLQEGYSRTYSLGPVPLARFLVHQRNGVSGLRRLLSLHISFDDPCLHVILIRAGFTSSNPTEVLIDSATGLLGTRAVCPDSRPNSYVFSITIFPFWRGGWAGLSVLSRLNASLVLTPSSYLLSLSSLCAHPRHHHLLIPSFIHQFFFSFLQGYPVIIMDF